MTRYLLGAFALASVGACEQHTTTVLCGFGPVAIPAIQIAVRTNSVPEEPLLTRADDVFVAMPPGPLQSYAARFNISGSLTRSEFDIGESPGIYALAIRRTGFAPWDSANVHVQPHAQCPGNPAATRIVQARLTPVP